MKHSKFGALVAAAGVAGLMSVNAVQAQRLTASNGMKAEGDPSANGRFEVLQLAGKGASDYWCAAGEYVIQRLGMSTGTRIYLDQAMGPGRMGIGNSAGYTAIPNAELLAIVEGQSKGYAMSITKVGDNWPAEHSREQCSTANERRR